MAASSPRLDSTTIGTGPSSRILADQLQAVDVGQAEIEQHQVGPVMAQRRQRLRAGRRLDRAIVVRAQRRAQQPADRRLVLDDQDGGGVAGHVGILSE